nr:hypothetical protein CFP56_27979 [Quercus suber]
MEGEVHGEVVPENVLQGDGGFESHVDISQGICGIKTKPTVDLQEMRIKCCLSSMEGEVHGEVVPENVLQGDGGFESHVDISQGICGIKTKPTVDSSANINSHKEHGNVEQPSQLVDNITQESFSCNNLVEQDNVVGLNGLNQESFDCEFLVGQDNIVGLNGLNQEYFDCEFLVGQDHVGLYDLNQVSVDSDIDNL